MSAVWSSARSAVRVHRWSLAGSALVVALAAALLTATGAWVEAGIRLAAGSADPAASTLITVSSSFAGTAVLIALFVVASTVAAALRPRAREFALLRAVGATTRQVRQMVTAEVLLLFAVAAPAGVLPGLFLAPLLGGPLADGGVLTPGFDLGLSPWPVLATLALLVPVAIGAARLAGRESARLSPAGAVRSSAVEPAGLSRGRRIAAVVLAAVGLGLALVPFVLPGLMGSAAATVSAIVLIIAVALLGPALIGWVARHALAAGVPGATSTLALTNARGFSRRLTGAVVPLMLLLALGTVQSGANLAILDGTERQVAESLDADLVLTGDPAALDRVAALPGVTAGQTALLAAQVRVDQDETFLSWESLTLRTVPEQGDLIDPGVRSGDLADLAQAGTIAVSREAAFEGMATIGDPIGVRVDGVQTDLTVVAVYERGLGLGDYLIGSATAAALGGEPSASTLLLRLNEVPESTVRAAAGGLTVTDVPGYAAEIRASASGQQGLSSALLFALLAFVGVAAANTLAMLIGSRRGEFALLHRTGATRRQLLGMVAAESGLLTGVALLAGIACVLPALAGVAQGMSGVPVPVFDGGVLAVLAAVVVLIGVPLPLLVALRVTSSGVRA
ncbi:FtsX-like permease family protein [Cellulomonas denverensis]|uniref:ABC transporter permease n=1 Tax=Cellulomonas denverensis TaxID=264297 RepID=A0A7X6QXT9_9CELL|nr:ABC transporter permease [Cellulomonas denverensis]NKY21281.1 ABC transporter permease [Cellulomonas denverensis]GIG24574.1 ABC transporter permease [Cellulomonas denverensis]